MYQFSVCSDKSKKNVQIQPCHIVLIPRIFWILYSCYSFFNFHDRRKNSFRNLQFFRLLTRPKISALNFKICALYFKISQTYFFFAPRGVQESISGFP